MGDGVRNLFLRLFETQESLSDIDVKRGVRFVTMDGICTMAMVAVQGGPFLPAFALALGGTNYEIGLLASIGFISQFMQLLGLFVVKKLPKRRAITVLSATMSRLLWIFIILTPLLFMNKGVTFLLQWLLFSALIGALPGPAWNSLLRDIVPEKSMGKVFSRRIALGTALGLVLTVIAGYFVDWWQTSYPDSGPYAYSILFGCGLLFGLLGIYSLARLPEPSMKIDEGISILQLMKKPLKDKNFRKIMVFIATWNFAVNLAGPFFIIYMLKRLELSLFMVTVLTVTSQLANILFLRIWGKLADRYSNKSVMAVSGFFFLLAVLGWTFTTMPEKHLFTFPLLFVIQIFSGMALAGTSLASANIALKLSPTGLAHSYMTAYGLAGAVTGAIAPILGGVLADFFAFRELSISINWAEPTTSLSMTALNFKALDFLFFIAFIVGLYALHRLSSVKEEGEVTEEEVRTQLMNEMLSPVRRLSGIPGIRHLVEMPTSFVNILRGKRTQD